MSFAIDYPFWYDGTVYFGSIAQAYNAPNLGVGIAELWGLQSPLYLNSQLLCLKIIGFSYPNALAVQMLCVLLLLTTLFFNGPRLTESEI
jgi:hypothetical protein